jgi:starch synthase (maltosyl-transferring)
LELTQYLTELTTTDARYTMRPNFFVNTPDINPVYLQTSGRAGFRIRLSWPRRSAAITVYIADLSSARPNRSGQGGVPQLLKNTRSRAWEWDKPWHIRPDIRLINRLRRDHPALQHFANVRFYNA